MATIFEMTIEEIMEVNVEVASLFPESEMTVGSSVVKLTSKDWEKLGAKQYSEAFNNQPGIASFLSIGGAPIFSVRGYTTNVGYTGLSILVDGVPMTEMVYGGATYTIPMWELGTIDRIEMIKGPGSALYGSDAFHGVISLKTFESDENKCSTRISGGSPSFYQGSAQLSQGFDNDRFRIDISGGFSNQGNKKIDSTINNRVVADQTNVSNARYDDYEEVTTRQKRKFTNHTGI